MSKQLGQSDLEDLSAFIDGELPDERAAEIQRLVDADLAWQAASRDMTVVDAAMDVYDAPAAPPNLAARIAANIAKAAPARSRLIYWLAPLAAAAAIVLAMLVYHSITGQQAGVGPIVNVTPSPAPVNEAKEVDQFASENFDFVKELDVLNNFETIKAIDKVEEESNG